METQDGLFTPLRNRKFPAQDHTFANDDSNRLKFTDHEDRPQLDCCSKCQAMTGTFEGLTALLDVDGDGYEHYNWQEIQDAKSNGCVLCQYICDISGGKWSGEYDGVNDRIRVYADTKTVDATEGERHAFSHPLAGVHLEGLSFHVPGSNPDPVALVRKWMMDIEGKLATEPIHGPVDHKYLCLVTFKGTVILRASIGPSFIEPTEL